MTQITYSVCTICDIGCQLRLVSEDCKVKRVPAHDHDGQCPPVRVTN